MTERLHPADLTAIAELVAARVLLALDAPAALTPRTPRLVSAAELALTLGVTRGYVYAHADELGAERLGAGPRARLRFDLDRARRVLGSQSTRSTELLGPSEPRRADRGGHVPGSILTSRPRAREAA